MQANMSVQDFVNNFRMLQDHPLYEGKVWIYLEGTDDKKLFGTIFPKDRVELAATNGITSVKSVISRLLQLPENYQNVIGIVDADFDRILNIKNQNTNIFLTDNHDAEMMLIQNDFLFQKITLIHLADDDTADRYDSIKLREKILEVLVWFSLIRLKNMIDDLGLVLENFPIHECIDFQADNIMFDLDKNKCLMIVNRKSPNKKRVIDETDIAPMLSESFDYWNLCNGHDFLKVWAKCIHCLNNKNFNDKKLHEDICLVFNLDMFKKTQLYEQLKNWEKCFALSLFSE
jgi:hypothetical protein